MKKHNHLNWSIFVNQQTKILKNQMFHGSIQKEQTNNQSFDMKTIKASF